MSDKFLGTRKLPFKTPSERLGYLPQVGQFGGKTSTYKVKHFEGFFIILNAYGGFYSMTLYLNGYQTTVQNQSLVNGEKRLLEYAKVLESLPKLPFDVSFNTETIIFKNK